MMGQFPKPVNKFEVGIAFSDDVHVEIMRKTVNNVSKPVLVISAEGVDSETRVLDELRVIEGFVKAKLKQKGIE